MWACYKGRVEVARCLLERNADVHAQGNFNISSLIWAAGRGHSEIVKELLEHGAKAITADKVQPHFNQIFNTVIYVCFLICISILIIMIVPLGMSC
jgi:ankyrin repeat protein